MQIYTGEVTDSSRWSAFAPRPGDVIVSTPPKCGTTWMMGIVAMLLNGSATLPAPVGVMSPWLDYTRVPLEPILETFDQQSGRRLIKTHTPLDGVPIVAGVSYITVFRHPLDAFRSMRRHLFNMREPTPNSPFGGTEAETLSNCIDMAFLPTAADDLSLELIAHHLSEARRAAARATAAVMVAHYSDMQRDLADAVARVAAHLEARASPDLLADVTGAADFDSMRGRATDFAPNTRDCHFKSLTAFFSEGQSAASGDISDDLERRFANRLAQLLSPEDAKWLLEGGWSCGNAPTAWP